MLCRPAEPERFTAGESSRSTSVAKDSMIVCIWVWAACAKERIRSSSSAAAERSDADWPSSCPGMASVDGALGRDPGHSGADLSPAGGDLEHVRSFARAAQAQMQSIMDSFASELNRLGDVSPAVDAGRPTSRDVSGWQIEAPRHSSQDPRHSA